MATKKLGRPPDSSSEETRERILRAARGCFAQYGFEGTTNRQLATAAELTTGAIYHYFGSKQELYLEAHNQVQRIVYERFIQATAGVGDSFVEQIEAVLDEALALQREDPTLANFLVATRTDVHRHAELADEPRLRPDRRLSFFGQLIDRGIETGEVRAEDGAELYDVINALMMGLTSASLNDPKAHERAISGVKRLIAGTLITSTDR